MPPLKGLLGAYSKVEAILANLQIAMLCVVFGDY